MRKFQKRNKKGIAATTKSPPNFQKDLEGFFYSPKLSK
jgi:hypothetical protein